MQVIKLLHIEDDGFNSKSFCRIIEIVYPNIELTLVKDSEEAESALKTIAFDCILVDLDLRGSPKQGWEIIQAIREYDLSIPIYVLTGIEYEGILPIPNFKEKYNIKKWLRKPLGATTFCDDIIKEFS